MSLLSWEEHRGPAHLHDAMRRRSYWIPGSYAPPLSKKGNSSLSLLKNKGFKEERMTKVGWYAVDTSTTLESNKSLPAKEGGLMHAPRMAQTDFRRGWWLLLASGVLLALAAL